MRDDEFNVDAKFAETYKYLVDGGYQKDEAHFKENMKQNYPTLTECTKALDFIVRKGTGSLRSVPRKPAETEDELRLEKERGAIIFDPHEVYDCLPGKGLSVRDKYAIIAAGMHFIWSKNDMHHIFYIPTK